MESYTLPKPGFERSSRDTQLVASQARPQAVQAPSEAARELVAALITLAIAQKTGQRRPN